VVFFRFREPPSIEQASARKGRRLHGDFFEGVPLALHSPQARSPRFLLTSTPGSFPEKIPRLSSTASPLMNPPFARLPFPRWNARQGVALVLVLAFVVLLASIIVAFFSRAQAEQQVSRASANQTKVKLLADGAMDTIIGDLKAGMAADSVVVTTNGATIYEVTNPATMVPERTDSDLESTSNTNYANLVTYSGTKMYAGAASDRADGDLTTATNAAGRSISTDRWNKPLFVPDAGKNVFDKVKWITVNRKGENGSTSSNSKISDTDAVIGRYAYVVYDEGGLLDLNVAGYPSASSGTTWDAALDPSAKSAVAYADLTQIPDVTQGNVDGLVNWRNAASLVSPGYRTYVESNTSGFLRAGNTGLSKGDSDHLFSSRQQMIAVLTGKLGWNKDTLQYFTSYSRDINQPSLAPDHSSLPRLRTLANGGNDQSQTDYDKLNPKFLEITAQSNFTRNDGSKAVAGEPLVKRRFALNRLIWLTYRGPSQGKTGADIDDLETNLKVPQAWLEKGTEANIRNDFGLRWNSGGFWTYQDKESSSTSTTIKTLDQVAALNREPNFIELLKASIATGALGKSSSSHTESATAFDYNDPVLCQYIRDKSVDNQIIQIAANIIDQSDVDGYPTRIQFNGMEFRGIENLPYIYRTRNTIYKLSSPNPFPPNTGNSIFFDYSGPPSDRGTCMLVQQPEIWNPHFYYAPTGNEATAQTNRLLGFPRPGFSEGSSGTATGDTKALELVVYMGSPGIPKPNVQPGQFSMRTHTRDYGRGGGTWPYHSEEQFFSPLDDQNTLMTFSNKPDLYREPTLLIQPNLPTDSYLTAPGLQNISGISSFYDTSGGVRLDKTQNANDATPYAYTKLLRPPSSNSIFLGIFLGKNDVVFPQSSGSNRYWFASSASASGFSGLLYQLRYKDASGQSIVYDEKYFNSSRDSEHLPGTVSIIGRTDNVNGYQVRMLIGADQIMGGFDPRTSRFGMLFSPCADSENNGNDGNTTIRSREFPPRSRTSFISRTAPLFVNKTGTYYNTLASNRPDLNAGFGFIPPSEIGGDFGPNPEDNSPENYASHYVAQESSYPPTNSKGWIWKSMLRPGLFAQNIFAQSNNGHFYGTSATVDYSEQAGNTDTQYYADADGVVRRATGAFSANSSTPASPDTAGAALGLPLATTKLYLPSAPQVVPDKDQMASRPVILNRPFRNVGELSNVFSDTPWKNLDFSTPESGFSSLLDAFCISDSDNAGALVSGKINLNTRQKPVLKAIFAGAYRSTYSNLPNNQTTPGTPENLDQTDAENLAALLVDNRTHSTAANKGPLRNISELVGKLKAGASLALPIDGSQQYEGFSSDIDTLATSASDKIPRYRESAIRALSSVGTTRTWNLMVDLIAQTGRASASPSGSRQFIVDGEQRYWVHLAMDRFTGKILDQQIEVVKE
jgi:hypothetical protein